jgi:AraC-like DNA-binding protein
MPPIAYRNRVRCRIAAELLTKSTLSIAEIADRVGFGSTSDFYRAFRTFYAVSPSEYRKESKRIS